MNFNFIENDLLQTERGHTAAIKNSAKGRLKPSFQARKCITNYKEKQARCWPPLRLERPRKDTGTSGAELSVPSSTLEMWVAGTFKVRGAWLLLPSLWDGAWSGSDHGRANSSTCGTSRLTTHTYCWVVVRLDGKNFHRWAGSARGACFAGVSEWTRPLRSSPQLVVTVVTRQPMTARL